MRSHSQGAISSADCYGHAVMVTVNALQLIFCGWYQQTGQITKQRINIMAANNSTVTYFVAPSKPCLAKAIQLIAVQDVVVTLHVLSDFRNMLQ